jgi:hypothetical protein
VVLDADGGAVAFGPPCRWPAGLAGRLLAEGSDLRVGVAALPCRADSDDGGWTE